ncbi:ParB N-terminal domain-containing protein [Larkinella sp.]|uniref:ParB N-terminal domain-containing protein n=1 Tax=Larkinella sp. TaxID=2034517 RepID=UPI003BAA0856
MFEYSDGYSKQDSRYSTGSMEFNGTYQDAGDGPGKRDNPASSKKKDKVSGPLLSESGQTINPDGSAYFDPSDRTNAWLFAADKRDEDDPTRIIDNLITIFSPTKLLGGLGLLSKSNPGSKIVAAKQLAAKVVTKLSPFELEITHGITKSKNAFAKLKEDIKLNGVQESIKFVEHNGKRFVVDGHHRLRAAKELGIQDVPVQQVKLPYAGYKTVEDLIYSPY